MAGDWIKMRTDLLTSPKVVRISSALNADRFRIAGGLLSVWSLFDVHSADGVLHGYTVESLDDLAAWPGFSAAMISVGWLIESDGNLELPRFDVHNGTSAKRRCQDADRKKTVRKVSASDADKMRTREEKRREDKEQDQEHLSQGEGSEEKPPRSKTLKLADLINLGVNEQHAKDWLAVRKQKKSPLTETAMAATKREADKAGLSIADAVQMAAEQGWAGFKADWVKGVKQNNKPSMHHSFDKIDYMAGVTGENDDGSFSF